MIVDQNAPPAVPDKLSAEPAQENDLADITETVRLHAPQFPPPLTCRNQDLPPIYTQSHEGNAESSTSNPPSSSRSPPNIKPSNHIRVLQQNTSIKGSWLINPALRIPAVFLPPLADDETDTTRKNISLESKNGSLEVAIYVVPTQGEGADPKPSRQRVTIDTSSRNGPVTTAVVRRFIALQLEHYELTSFDSTRLHQLRFRSLDYRFTSLQAQRTGVSPYSCRGPSTGSSTLSCGTATFGTPTT